MYIFYFDIENLLHVRARWWLWFVIGFVSVLADLFFTDRTYRDPISREAAHLVRWWLRVQITDGHIIRRHTTSFNKNAILMIERWRLIGMSWLSNERGNTIAKIR